jgi:hypothetical protein
MRAEHLPDHDWMPLPGGELEAPRPKTLCPACRAKLRAGHKPAGRTLCFACYRADLERDRRLKAAGQLDTASEARFQFALPFEPVNRVRLEMLRAERTADAAARRVAQPAVVRRRTAQIEARHALQRIVDGLKARKLEPQRQAAAVADAMHAAELQLPESWMPFVVER